MGTLGGQLTLSPKLCEQLSLEPADYNPTILVYIPLDSQNPFLILPLHPVLSSAAQLPHEGSKASQPICNENVSEPTAKKVRLLSRTFGRTFGSQNPYPQPPMSLISLPQGSTNAYSGGPAKVSNMRPYQGPAPQAASSQNPKPQMPQSPATLPQPPSKPRGLGVH